jgi:hypothetical protein
VRFTTETGSVYVVDDRSICQKMTSTGKIVDTFKVFFMKAVPEIPTTWEELQDIPESVPVVGQHLFVSGRDTWWLSTAVVSVED